MNDSLLSRAFLSLLLAQFLSALADNMVLIAAIALLKTQSHFTLVPLLQASFLVAYIVLAPYTGPFADGHPKSRVLFYTNGIKLGGLLLLLMSVHPLLSYGIIGIGAATYSPAKYGILPELVSKHKLIKANSLIESSTIIAILTGVFVGGVFSDYSVHLSLLACGIAYFLSGLINLMMPKTPIVSAFNWRKMLFYTKYYFHTVKLMCQDPGGRYSIIGTTAFWSAGATLRLLLFAWIPVVFLNFSNALPSDLMGVLSVGVAVGALGAGLWIKFSNLRFVLIPGLLLGPLVIATAFVQHLWLLGLIMFALGACGGLFVIPLNALMQERGHQLIGTGRALAVQNFFENIGMFVMVLFYNFSEYAHVPLKAVILTLGIITLLMLLYLTTLKFNPQVD